MLRLRTLFLRLDSGQNRLRSYNSNKIIHLIIIELPISKEKECLATYKRLHYEEHKLTLSLAPQYLKSQCITVNISRGGKPVPSYVAA